MVSRETAIKLKRSGFWSAVKSEDLPKIAYLEDASEATLVIVEKPISTNHIFVPTFTDIFNQLSGIDLKLSQSSTFDRTLILKAKGKELLFQNYIRENQYLPAVRFFDEIRLKTYDNLDEAAAQIWLLCKYFAMV